MALLVDRALEKKALKLITSGHDRSAWLLGKLSSESFGTKTGKEAFRLIERQAKKTSTIPAWEDLLHDPSLSEATRKALAVHKKRAPDDKEYAQAIQRNLDQYRKTRVLYEALENAGKAMEQESFDAEAVADSMADVAMRVRSKSEILKTYHIGEGNNSAKLVKKILAAEALPAVRTGIRAFDDMNRGIFFGSLLLLGANTGGLKTTMALQLSQNFANDGAKVCMVSLEMEEDEVMVRNLSRYSGVSMSRLINPKDMSPGEIKKVERAYAARVKSLKSKNASETIHVPTEDVSIEELLFSIKPFGYDVIMIDYITLLKGADGDDQWRKLGQIARFAKIFAKNNNCIVVLLVQVTQEGMVRYSKTIVEHANNAWFWVRDQQAKDTGIITIQQPKARNQRDTPFQVFADPEHMRIGDVDPKYMERIQAGLGPGIGHNSGKFGQAANSNGKGRGGGRDEKRPAFKKQVLDDEDSYFDPAGGDNGGKQS